MATQNYFILTATQRNAVMVFNTVSTQVDPRAVDATSPGSGININEQAVGFSVGDPVSLTGKYVCAVRIVNDPVYQADVPDMVAYLLDMPAALLENETIFAPADPV